MAPIPRPALRPPRKTRCDARLARLTAVQRQRLHDWLYRENRTYAAVVQLVRDEFGLGTSRSAVAVYYQRHLRPRPSDEYDTFAATLSALRAGHVDPGLLHRARALAFAALHRPSP